MTDTVAESIQELDQAQVLRTAAGSRRRRYLAVVLGWLVFIGLWWLAALWVDSEARLPSPGRVFQEIRRSSSRAISGPSSGPASSGSSPDSSPLSSSGLQWGSSWAGASTGATSSSRPVIVAGSIPGLTYAVMAFVVFGISFWGPVLAVGLIAMPYVAINVAEGVRGVDRATRRDEHGVRTQ